MKGAAGVGIQEQLENINVFVPRRDFYLRKQPKAIKEDCIHPSRIHPAKLIGTLYTTISP